MEIFIFRFLKLKLKEETTRNKRKFWIKSFSFFLKYFCGQRYQWKIYNISSSLKTKEQQRRSNKRTSPFKDKKNIGPSLILNFKFFSFLIHFQQFKNLQVHHLKLSKSSWKCKHNGMMIKDLELQNSNCSCAPKPNIDTFHLQKAYLAHFEINFSDSCGLGCTR